MSKKTKAVLDGPNTRRITRELAERQAEIEALRCRGWQAVDPNGSLARELLVYVDSHGSVTPEFASREIELSPDAVLIYAEVLARAGKVQIIVEPSIRKKRGQTVIQSIRVLDWGGSGL